MPFPGFSTHETPRSRPETRTASVACAGMSKLPESLSQASNVNSGPVTGPAQGIASNLLNDKVNRQEYLEAAIRWMNDGDVEGYMSKHQHDKNAVALWNHFRSVIDWVNATFTKYRKHMKGVEWGPLYNRFKDADLDPVALETETRKLMMDDDVTSKSGIYPYLLDGDERHLSIRAFTDAMKAEAFERQNGICPTCKESFSIDDMDGDHIDPWSKGGKTTADNCQMLCKPCNRRKCAK